MIGPFIHFLIIFNAMSVVGICHMIWLQSESLHGATVLIPQALVAYLLQRWAMFYYTQFFGSIHKVVYDHRVMNRAKAGLLLFEQGDLEGAKVVLYRLSQPSEEGN